MFIRLVDFCTRVMMTVSAAIVGLLAFPVAYDALTRAMRTPAIWVFDVTLYLLIACGFLGSAYALRTGSHFRMVTCVDLAGPNVRRWADRFAYAATLAFALIMLWLTAGYTLDNYETGFRSGTILNAPLWIPQITMPIGALVLALEALRALVLDEYADVTEG
jgi:TRAP-type C4-dicarboxylate transport system permease small subunit